MATGSNVLTATRLTPSFDVKKVVVLDAHALYPAESPQWDVLRRIVGPHAMVEIYDTTPSDLIVGRAQDAQVVFTNKVPMTDETMAALPSLRYIGVLATGYNLIDIDAANAQGVTVTNIPAYSTDSVAQMAIALLLEVTNRVGYYNREVHRGRWSECDDFTFRDFPLTELAGKCLGIVGLGHIGHAVARIAAAMGIRIAVLTSKPQSELPEGYIKLEHDDFFRQCDVVSLHCPLTDQTREMINSSVLALMKPTAILVNTSRGQLVAEADLACALNDGRIGAAALDVLAVEPPLDSNPLLSARNCIVTPHIAWASEEARQRLFDNAMSNLADYLNN